MLGAQLSWRLNEAGIHPAALIIKDELYKALSAKWILVNFTFSLRAHLKVAGLIKWDEERTDCDDYADEARLLMQRIHRQTPGSANSAAAFGLMRYKDKLIGWHWINFAIVAKGRVLFYDPQFWCERVLNQQELNSVNAIYV